MARTPEFKRSLDRLLGFSAAVPLSRRPRRMPDGQGRVVLVQPTAIGDTLISSGAVAAIARRFARAEVIMAHGANNAVAATLIDAPLKLVQFDFGNILNATSTLRALKPDIVIDLTPWPYVTALAARLTPAWSAGFQPPFGLRGRYFDLAVPHLDDRHEIENLRAMATALGAEGADEMAIRRNPQTRPANIEAGDLVLFHVSAGGSGAASKAWPDAHWIALLRALVADGWRVGFTGAPADEKQITPILAEAGLPEDCAFSLAGRMKLDALAELLAHAQLLVSIDTGVLHLAAAVNGRAIGLHGPTLSARWGCLSRQARSLDAPHAAGGFIKYGWEKHPQAMEVMLSLTPERVIAAAREMLTARVVGRARAM
jgi:ADP-heptose:LPS heptosyltransferase